MRKEEPMNTKNLRRGATLTELMVVIAVIAIVAVMVVSFSAMVSGGREMAQAKLDALQDIRLAESVIENFIEENANNGYIVSVEDGGKHLFGSVGKLVFYEEINSLFIHYNDDSKQPLTIKLESVTGITFTEHGTDDKIYYCTITYDIGGTNNERYTFCVNPYAGEKI